MEKRYGTALILPADSKFDGLGFGLPPGAVNELNDLLVTVAGGSQSVIESFQRAFGGVGSSSNYSWATTDLSDAMRDRSDDAAFFLGSLWDALSNAESRGIEVPPYRTLNRILRNNDVPLRITEEGSVEQLDGGVVISPGSGENDDNHDYLHRLQIGAKLGEGGYGVVYKATRSTDVSDFQFAVKLLDPSPFVSDRNKAIKRFQREVKAIQSLDHRAIIQYVEAGLASDGKPYILMPLIRGSDIRTRCSKAEPSLIVNLFSEILRGLAHAHNNGVLHRDLKPSNILVRASDDQPVILDFGSAYLLDEITSASLTTQVVGTIGYIPSEVLADPSRRSALQDIYACGVLLYEALVGRRPDPANYQGVGLARPELSWIDPILKDAIAGERYRLSSAVEFEQRLRTQNERQQ